MYTIDYTPSALLDLKSLRKSEQQVILDGIDDNLRYQPTVETKHRKKLEPNELADWELRRGNFRVFYNVEDELIVVVKVIGEKKHNALFVRGKRRLI